MMSLLALLLRVSLLAVFTFGFVVLYEHGTSDFVQGAATEWKSLTEFVSSQGSAKAPAAPSSQAPTP
ncbi:hypothetical protein TSACC_3197 [Terrimicrobium sacchariphilum]|jgi:hypothetical protein|uniref:Uncharacterized protein n=1 Tax=Terrimicrobium sacchariphilum TaxID=690879 RepID=A0A146GD93_TERSA|nr:hypothetical protein [Terrimicrobium sacchariphilum]GAT35133.1 hypothetical protein TSACC_3197 [Terrimicrobium sacchariphilum]